MKRRQLSSLRAPRRNASAGRSALRSIILPAGPGMTIAAPAGSRTGAAYATYVGSWRKRFG